MTVIANFIRIIGLLSLGATVFAAPWCYGGLYASSQVWFFRGITAALVCALLTVLLDVKTRFRFPVLLVPVLLILLLIGLQLREYDHEALSRHSPKVAELRELLLPAEDSEEYRWMRDEGLGARGEGLGIETPAPIPYSLSPFPAATSIYPAATRHQLALFVLVISAFYSALVLFQHRITILIFAVTASLNGCALALLGIVMRLNTHLSTLFVYENSRHSFGSFLQKNNAAGYLGMCLGTAVILMLWQFFHSERKADENRRWDHPFENPFSSFVTSLLRWWHQNFAHVLSPLFLTWGLVAGILMTGVLVSMSRGGSVAVAVALCLSFLAVFSTRRLKWSLIAFAVVGLLGFGLVFWIGMDESVQARLDSITDEKADGARLLNWSNAMQTARDLQWRGAGFGTYQYANLLNDELAAKNRIAVRAENQYVEIFLDLGIRGLFLLLACLVTAIALCLRFIRQRHDLMMTAIGGGLLVVVITQAVASIFDFGLYLAANALIFAVCCGILSAAATSGGGGGNNRWHVLSRRWQPLSRGGLFATGCLFLALTWGGYREIGNIHRIDLAMERLAEIGDDRSASPEEWTDAVAQLEAAIQHRPDDATATLTLAQTQIGLYRQTIYRELLSARDPMMSDDDIWNRTSLLSVHEAIGRLRRLGFRTQVNAVREHPAVEHTLRPAFANLVRSRQSNPMSVRPHLLIAQLVPILDKDDTMQEFEQNVGKRATKVSPFSAAAWYQTGILERNLGRTADARACWKQSLSLSRLYLKPIVQFTKADMHGNNAQNLFRETFPNFPDLFLTLTWQFTDQDIPNFRQEALEALKESCETAVDITEGERHYYRGRYEMLIKNGEAAVTELKAACATQRSNPEWRYQLAQACYSNRQYKEAEEEIKSALFYDPGNKTYLKLRDKIQKALVLH